MDKFDKKKSVTHGYKILFSIYKLFHLNLSKINT